MTDVLTANVDGNPVYIEIESTRVTRGGSSGASSIPKGIETVTDALDNAKNTILNVTKKMVGAIHTADQAITPNEFSLEFSIKFTAEGQAIIAKAGSEASLTVKMVYQHKPESKGTKD